MIVPTGMWFSSGMVLVLSFRARSGHKKKEEVVLMLSRLCKIHLFFLLVFGVMLIYPEIASATDPVSTAGTDLHAWWFWPIILFFFCFVLGVIAVLAGVGGGGVVCAPGQRFFFRFTLTLCVVRACWWPWPAPWRRAPGFCAATWPVCGWPFPWPWWPPICAVIGAMLGLYLSSLNPDIIQVCLGMTIVGIAVLLLLSKNTEKAGGHQAGRPGTGPGYQWILLGRGFQGKSGLEDPSHAPGAVSFLS